MQAHDQRQMSKRLPSRRSQSLHRRVLTVILLVTVAAILVFAAPLAYAVRQIYRGAELAALQRDAVSIAATMSDSAPEATPMRRPSWLQASLTAGLYRGDRLVSGTGPSHASPAQLTQDGRPHAVLTGHLFAAAAPVQPDESTGLVVVVTAADHEVVERTLRAWLVMSALALGVLGVAAVVAHTQARRLVRPLETLAASARALGAGEFTIRTRTSGIKEADEASTALEQTAVRLGQVRERERLFARDVSHQLRTPLTGLMVTLEGALTRPDADLRRALERGLERAHSLESTIDDLLELTQPAPEVVATDVGQVLEDTVARWTPQFAERRRVLVTKTAVGLPAAAASVATVRQVLEILLDNALLHGAGKVLASVREIPGGIALDVEDEGEGMPPEAARRTGVGLPLARTLSAASGARLLVIRSGQRPLFRLLIPLHQGERSPGTTDSKR